MGQSREVISPFTQLHLRSCLSVFASVIVLVNSVLSNMSFCQHGEIHTSSFGKVYV